MLLLAGVFSLASISFADEIKLEWDHGASTVTADITEAPLRQVLEQVRIKTGWEIFIEPGMDMEVSTAFRDLSQGRALGRLLSTANFALVPREGQAAKLLVFDTRRDNATEQILDAHGAAQFHNSLYRAVVKVFHSYRLLFHIHGPGAGRVLCGNAGRAVIGIAGARLDTA